MSDPIQAIHVESIIDAMEAKQGGAFKFYTDGHGHLGMHIVCPKCFGLAGVSFAPGRWTFDGNREAPTVRASILHNPSECGWHGFLTAGRFEEC